MLDTILCPCLRTRIKGENDGRKTYKILTKHTFIEAAIEGEKIGFNRDLSPLALDDLLPDDEIYPIIGVLIHEHIVTKPFEPHFRATIVLHNTNMVIMDMKMETYHGLPEVVVPH